ncbi:MAG: succinyl-diaminopimelate desuccinylase [Acidimicrobiia bacterium]
MTDLLARTAALVDIPSVSHHEAGIADHIEAELGALPWLVVDRVGDNVVARTTVGRRYRLVLAGHTDTVPAAGNGQARTDGDVLWGVGAADMKSGLAVMLELARTVPDPAIDLTYVFYAAEEVAAVHNGLGQLFSARPDLLEGDAALLGEPTGADVEAGCQGTLRAEVVLHGTRAHTARPWMGRNAIHRLGRLLAVVDGWEGRRPVLSGCEYREALQAVAVEGGVAGNVVPDRAKVVLNHRFAPDRDPVAAEAWLRGLLAPALDAGDEFVVTDVAPAAVPGVDHPVLAALVERNRLDVRAKLGWTDVARFSAWGVPAANFGPGDPQLAHTPEERVGRAELEKVFAVLHDLVTRWPG